LCASAGTGFVPGFYRGGRKVIAARPHAPQTAFRVNPSTIVQNFGVLFDVLMNIEKRESLDSHFLGGAFIALRCRFAWR